MGEELVISSSPLAGGGEKPVSRFPYKDFFNENLPYYLVMGMTAGEFWDGDPALAAAYRKAYQLKQKIEVDKMNQSAWMMGRYAYDAILCASPAFGWKPRKPMKYVDMYEIKQQEEKPKSPRDEEREKMEANKRRFLEMAARVNSTLNKRKEG